MYVMYVRKITPVMLAAYGHSISQMSIKCNGAIDIERHCTFSSHLTQTFNLQHPKSTPYNVHTYVHTMYVHTYSIKSTPYNSIQCSELLICVPKLLTRVHCSITMSVRVSNPGFPEPKTWITQDFFRPKNLGLSWLKTQLFWSEKNKQLVCHKMYESSIILCVQ